MSDGPKGIFKGAQMRQLAGTVQGFEGNNGRRGAIGEPLLSLYLPLGWTPGC